MRQPGGEHFDKPTGPSPIIQKLIDLEVALANSEIRIRALEAQMQEIAVKPEARLSIYRRFRRSIRLAMERIPGGARVIQLYVNYRNPVVSGIANSTDNGLAVEALARNRGLVLLSNSHVRSFHASRACDDDLPELTISAVLYNSVRWLPDFFSALLLSHYPLDRLSLIFVDNSSTDETPQHVRDWIKANSSKFRSAKLFVRPNDGYGAGNDFAIRQASTDFVLVTNVDGEFTRDLLRILAATAVSDSKKVASWEARQAPFEHPKYYDPVTLLTNWSSHACVLIRKAAYEASGGYEKRLFMYGEDVELSYRLRSKDYLLRYVPSAKFIHHTDIDVRGPRDLQLSGSLAANILLRHRYGKLVDALAGEALLRYLNSTERDTTRKIAIRAALRSVARHRRSFRDSRYRIFRMGRRRGFSFFPFSGFDYDITRDGAAHRSRLDLFSSDLPKVSIITRTIGERQWLLREAIASVLNQTYPNIEHIIVEDKGKESVGLVDSIRKKYGADIRFISSPTGGRSAAGNAGLKAATGEYILFLDDDDLLFPDHVETLVEALINSPEYMCAYSLAWMVPTEIASKLRSYHEIGHLMVHDHRRPFNRHRLHVENIAAIQSVIFRRRAYEICGGFHVDLDTLEDWNLWVRYAELGNFAYVEKLTSLYKVPADPEIGIKRQRQFDAAYKIVHERNIEDIAAIRSRRLDR